MPRCFASIAFALLASLPALGQDRIQTELTLDFASKYVNQGVNMLNAPAFQPGVTFSTAGFTLGVWGNLELNGWNEPNFDRNPRGQFSEFDTWLEYGWALKNLDWTFGFIDYQYPGTGVERYQEWYLGAGCDSLPGHPNLTYYQGAKSTGSYLALGLSHSLAVRGRSIDLAAEMSFCEARYNEFEYGHHGTSMSDLHLSAGSDFDLGKGWTLTPSLHYSTLMNKKLIEGQPRRTNVWFQVGLKLAF